MMAIYSDHQQRRLDQQSGAALDRRFAAKNTRDMINAARARGGFLRGDELVALASDPATRFTQILVRCGGGRFIVSAQDVHHFLTIIEREGSDYVRDVSLKTED